MGKNIKPIALEHLNRIEDPALAGEAVVVEAVVSSTSTAYLVPKALDIEYEEKRGEFDGCNVIIQKEDPVNIKFVRINDEVKDRRLKRLFARGKKVTRIDELAHRTVYRIRIRPPVFTLEKRVEKILDEKGFEYKAYDVYVVTDKNAVFQPSSLIRLERDDSEYTTRIAKTVKGARALLEAGFEYITDMEGYKLFRKRK